MTIKTRKNDEACRQLAEELQSADPGHSPIELALCNALCIMFNSIGAAECCVDQRPCMTFDEIKEDLRTGGLGDYVVTAFREVEIDAYRVDFLIVLRPLGTKLAMYVAVECDGHDWHERTKEQAAHDKRRDRHLQSLGLAVLRFTGSEIWKSPMACAVDLAFNLSDIATHRLDQA